MGHHVVVRTALHEPAGVEEGIIEIERLFGVLSSFPEVEHTMILDEASRQPVTM